VLPKFWLLNYFSFNIFLGDLSMGDISLFIVVYDIFVFIFKFGILLYYVSIYSDYIRFNVGWSDYYSNNIFDLFNYYSYLSNYYNIVSKSGLYFSMY